MRDKLIEYVRNLFRSASKNQKNEDLEAEILQNSLDRFDDLVSKGVSEESAYTQAVDSIGDVRQLMEQECQPQIQQEPKKKRTGLIVAAVVVGIVVLLGVLLAVFVTMFGINTRGSFHAETWEDRIEDWADGLERDADHWANGIEERVEQWVEQIDEEYGYSVIAPNSTFSYTDSERYTAGNAELPAEALESLSISWLAGTVTVEAWDGDTISIMETETEEERKQVHWLLEDGKLDINYCAAGTQDTLPRKELTVKLPRDLAENLRRLSISGISQDAVVTDLTVFQVYVNSTSGNLKFTGSTEHMDLDTTSGEFELDLAKTPDDLSFDSVSGSLTMAIPAGRCFEVDWETVSGKFDCDFEGKRSDDEWLFNAEENYYIRGEFDFETVSGDVSIKKK